MVIAVDYKYCHDPFRGLEGPCGPLRGLEPKVPHFGHFCGQNDNAPTFASKRPTPNSLTCTTHCHV